MIARVKKDDMVEITSGKEEGQRGTVIEILPKEGKVKVKGLGMITRHVKPTKQGEVGGIRKEEQYIPLARVMPVCPGCSKPCRTQNKVMAEGNKVRICSRCKEIV